jgi:simple sugar transport system ATP-binding protein
MTGEPLLDVRNVSKSFGSVQALRGVSLSLFAGEIVCLLGDNGAGKSTLIKILSGALAPDEGELRIDGERVTFRSPRAAIAAGISTVYQDLAVLPLLGITRNFFLGNEPVRRIGPFGFLDRKTARATVKDELRKLGIDVRDPDQPVGTLSGGERQSMAAARAVYFGARVLILDEPTSALGVKEATLVLRNVRAAAGRGTGVILITHNVHHAFAVGDAFVVLQHGEVARSFRKDEASITEVLGLMSGVTVDELREDIEHLAHGLLPSQSDAGSDPE